MNSNHAEISNARLATKLADETALREETETHLRIIRKALSVLEAESREKHDSRSDELLTLRDTLAQTIEQNIAYEAKATLNHSRLKETEDLVLDVRRKLVEAKKEVRHSTFARAKALGTANKSIAIARQSVRIRSRLEVELEEAQKKIDGRQRIINRLVKLLENERKVTEDEVTAMAKRLVIREKQRQSKRASDGVARSVEDKLTSRLVKKVAKARPLGQDLGNGGLTR